MLTYVPYIRSSFNSTTEYKERVHHFRYLLYALYISPQCHSLLKPRADLQEDHSFECMILYDCEV